MASTTYAAGTRTPGPPLPTFAAERATMAITTFRPARTAMVALALAATVLGAAGCAKKDPATPTPTSTSAGTEGMGSGPAPASAPPTAPPTTKPPAPSYPSTARAYAEAVLAAWKQGNLSRLGALTTPEVQEQIIEIPGPPNQTWTYRNCDGAAGSSYCSFVNANGDVITLRISHSLLSKAHAAVEVRFDQTIYASDPVEYVNEFIKAWQDANRVRMLKLSNSTAVDYFTHYTPPPSGYSTCTDGAMGTTYVRVYNPDGLNYTIKVTNTKLGGPNAISGNSDIAAACP
ncbi:MAG TPA: hypothetical protein VF163_03470 [Micromonosporaceae bacterium]